jgi:hypothetical protein
MTRIVAALFEDQIAAGRAIERVREHGAAEADVTTFVVNPPGMHHGLPLGGDEVADAEARGGDEGALRGAAIGGAAGVAAGLALTPLVGPVGIAAGIGAGALVGSIAGASSAMGDDTKRRPTARPGGVMVAVNAERVDESLAIDAFHANHAKLIEIDEGLWRDGVWVDFDPVGAPKEVIATTGNPNYPTDTTRAGVEQPR